MDGQVFNFNQANWFTWIDDATRLDVFHRDNILPVLPTHSKILQFIGKGSLAKSGLS